MNSINAPFQKHFLESIGRPLRLAIPLKDHASFRIGGNADYYFEADSPSDLIKALTLVRDAGVPGFVIGGGFNILFDDLGFRGMIIKNCSIGLEQIGSNKLVVDSGTPLKKLLELCAREGLQGLEFLAGIPGTLGGAVYGNAGAFGDCIGFHLKEVGLLNRDGQEISVPAESLEFGYRNSLLKRSGDILIKGIFELQSGDPDRIQSEIDRIILQRGKKHPPSTVACAGSYFKNPYPPSDQNQAAAVYLEKIGAKAIRIGQAAVSPVHANFIINEGGATAVDVLDLAAQLKARVKERFDVELEEEVIFLPEVPSKV
ncbi:UDP-N-acetylmuramate dehydrogenase [Acidobacteriota bacterium]